MPNWPASKELLSKMNKVRSPISCILKKITNPNMSSEEIDPMSSEDVSDSSDDSLGNCYPD